MKASTCLLALALSLLINTLNASEEPGVLSICLQYHSASQPVEGKGVRVFSGDLVDRSVVWRRMLDL